MNREAFDAITHAALTVADYQLELTSKKYAALEMKEKLYLTASKVRGQEALLTAWADSFFTPIDPFSTVKNKARQAKKDYVILFAAHAKPSLPNEKTADTDALETYKLSMQTANDQFRFIYLDTKDLSRALTVARQTFKTAFIVRLNRLHGTHFMNAMVSPDNMMDGIAAMSPCMPDRTAPSPDITRPIAVLKKADDVTSLDEELSRLNI